MEGNETADLIGLITVISLICFPVILIAIKKIEAFIPKLLDFLAVAWPIGIRLFGYALLGIFLFAILIAINESLFNSEGYDCEYEVGAGGFMCY